MVLRATDCSVKCKHLRPRKPPSIAAEWMVVLLFVTFHLYGIGVIQIAEISLSIWNIVIVAFFLYYIFINTIKNTLRISNFSKTILLQSFLFTAWVTACSLYSPLPERALTIVLLQIINFIALFMIVTSEPLHLDRVNTFLLKAGAVIAIVAIILYLSVFSRYAEIVADSHLWHSSVGYVLDAGGVLRLSGFAKDPNFYSLWMTLPLAIGIACGRARWWLWLPIAASVGLALSRSFFVAITVSSLFIIPLLMVSSASKSALRRLVALPLIGFVILLIATTSVNEVDYIAKRIDLIDQTPRFEYWRKLTHLMDESWNPLFGAGLRSTQFALSGKYSHSTYYDLVYETGIVGFLLWFTIPLLIMFKCFKSSSKLSRDGLPWIYSCTVLLIAFFSFSLLYHPFMWMVLGVLTNALGQLHNPTTGRLGAKYLQNLENRS